MRIKLLLNILILGLVYLSSTSSAYPLAHKMKSTPFKLYKNPRDEILKHWRNRAESISLGQEKTGIAELANIRNTMKQFGVKNLPEISISILKEVENRKGELPPEESLELAELAVSLSPDIPAVHFKIAPYYLSIKTFHPFKGANEFIEGIKLQISNVDNRITLLTNLTYWTALSLIVVLFVFMFACCLKYSTLLHHLLTHLLPKSFSRLAITLIIVFIPVIVFFILGPLSLVLIFAVYYWIFMNGQEKFISICLLLLIVLLPVLFYVPVFPIKFDSSNEAKILRTDFQSDYEHTTKVFAELIEMQPDDVEAKLTLALFAKRSGNLSASTKLLNEIIKKKPGWDKPYINLGNIFYIRGKIDSAISNYNKAASMNSNNFLAKYNLGKAYFKQTRLEDANTQLKGATTIDPIQFNLLESLSDPKTPSRYIFDETISYIDLEKRIRTLSKFDTAIRDRIWEKTKLINATPLTSSLITAIIIILLIILSKSLRAIAPPIACTICGTSFCKRCSQIMDRRNICSKCYFVFVSRDSIDPTFKLQKENDERKNKKKISIIKSLSSLVIPGFGHIYLGSSIFGLFIVFICSWIILKLSIPNGIVSDPLSIALKPAAFPTVILLLIVIATYVLTNLSLRRSR